MTNCLNIFLSLLVSTFLIHINKASAGIFLCNNTSEKLYVAIGYQESNHWLSKGWYTFSSNECDSLYLGVPQNRYFYYYANSEGSKSVWSGGNDPERGYFCTSSDAFYYNSDSNNCKCFNFSRIDLNGADQYWFSITDIGNPTDAALRCRSQIAEGRDAFAKCWMRGMATEKQREILNCWDNTQTTASFGLCVAKGNLGEKEQAIANCTQKFNNDRRTAAFASCVFGDRVGDPERRLINCAIDKGTDYSAALSCAALEQLTPEQRLLYQCAANNRSSYVAAGTCIATSYLSPEQSRIASCVMNNRGSYIQMGVCAAGNGLTPEQQVFAQCAVSTGGQPYAFAGCVGTQLTLNELQKCMTDGIGGSGCFGENNEAVKFTRNAFKDITQGPGPSNDLLGRDGWVGRNATNAWRDVTEGPGSSNDLVGKDGFVCRTLFGGC